MASKKHTFGLIFALFILASIGFVSADPDGWTDEIVMDVGGIYLDNPPTDTFQQLIDSEGNLHVVWVDRRDALAHSLTFSEIYYKKLTKDGTVLVNATRLTYSDYFSFNPSIAFDSDENVHIVWTQAADLNNGGGATNYYIYYSRLDLDGNTLINNQKLTWDSRCWNGKPIILVGQDNMIYLSWKRDPCGSGALQGIYLKKLFMNLTESFDILALSNWGQYSVAIDRYDNLNYFYLMGGGGHYEKINSSGGIVVDSKLVSTLVFDDPIIKVDENEDLHIAWTGHPNGAHGLKYLKLNSTGDNISIVKDIDTSPIVVYGPDLAVSDDELNFIWSDERTGVSGIYYKKLDLDGNFLTNDTIINDLGGSRPLGSQANPRINTDDVGRSYALYGLLGGGLSKRIVMKHSLTGEEMYSPELDFIGDKEIAQNQTLTIQLNAVDPRNLTLTYGTNALNILPGNVVFNENTGLFTWISDFSQLNEYEITFNVTNGEYSDEETIKISQEGVYLFDNLDNEFNVILGRWRLKDHVNAYGGNTRFIQQGIGLMSVGWRVDKKINPGSYSVYTWKFENQFQNDVASNAKYSVVYSQGSSNWIEVNQSSPGNEWILIGNFSFDNSSRQGVILSDNADGYVIADAVKLVYIN